MPDMNSKYVERVLSHIGKGTARAELKYELESHVDERCSYFQSLGYDEEAALEKAEEAMGDPDITGEQFYLQIKGEKRKNALYVFIAIATALLNYLFYGIQQYLLRSSSDYDIYFSEFWVFVASTIVYALTLFNIILGFKKKKTLNLISALLFGWISSFLFINCFITSIYYSCIKLNFAYYFIYNQYAYTSDIDIAIIEASMIISIIAMVLINIAGLVIIIKTRLLKNARKDLVFSKIVKTALSVWIVVCVLFTVITGLAVNSCYKSIPEDLADNAVRYEAIFLDNVDRFINIDDDVELERTLNEMFPEDSYVHYSEKGYPYHVADTHIITAYWDSYIIKKIDIDFNCNVNNPFSIYYSTSRTENRYALTKSDIRQDMTIQEAPLPADVYFTYDEEQNLCELNFDYACEDEYTFLRFTYDPETKSFNLTDSYAPEK